MSGIGSHQSARMANDSWLTPPEILHALGSFDLDPCACVDQPWVTAARMIARPRDGLIEPWTGRVWLNPPYGASTGRWLSRLAAHGDGIALIFARTETAMLVEHVWGKADAILFLHGRLHFHFPDGRRSPANAGGPSALIAYGEENVEALQRSSVKGSLVEGWR